MNQLSLETLKALIEINGDINSDYQHIDALFFRILKAAMRLVCCEMVCYITVENGVILKLVSKIKKDKELNDKEITYIVNIIMLWIKKQL